MGTHESVIEIIACQKCGAPIGDTCRVPSKRNHPQRVHDAIAEAIKYIPLLREV